MSRIKGLNDEVTLKKKPITPGITVWKGEKKGDKRAGINLNEKFRIEAPCRLKAALKSALQAEEKDGSLYVDHLNLVPAYEDEFKTFDSKMAAYNASRPILFCDRATINTRFIERKDPQGGIYFQPIEAEETCPVAGTNFDCPNKCARTGDFYFYIWELMLAGYAEFARLQVHGVADNQHIASVIDEVKASIGAIRTSPFVSEETRTCIVYQLSRRKVSSKYPVKEGGVRTAKRSTKDDWVVNLALHPMWLNKYQNHLSAQQLLAGNMQPSLKLITQVHGAGLIARQSVGEVSSLKGTVEGATESNEYQLTSNASDVNRYSLIVNQKSQYEQRDLPVWSMNEEKLAELKSLWQAHGWTKSALEELLFSYFNISDRASIMDLAEPDFERLKQLSIDAEIKKSLVTSSQH
jgi:hypothetical protein